MKLAHMYTGDDQKSHLREFDVSLAASNIGSVSAYLPVDRMRFRRRDLSMPVGYLNAPERQFAVILAGSVEIEVADGERRRFGAGDVVFAEDLSGRGHIARVDPFVEQIYIAVPDGFDLAAWIESTASQDRTEA